MYYSVAYIEICRKINVLIKQMKDIHPQLRVYIDFQLEGYLDHQKDYKVHFKRELMESIWNP